MPNIKKPTLLDFDGYTVFKGRGSRFKTVVVLLLLLIVSFMVYQISDMFLNDYFPFPK